MTSLPSNDALRSQELGDPCGQRRGDRGRSGGAGENGVASPGDCGWGGGGGALGDDDPLDVVDRLGLQRLEYLLDTDEREAMTDHTIKLESTGVEKGNGASHIVHLVA